MPHRDDSDELERIHSRARNTVLIVLASSAGAATFAIVAFGLKFLLMWYGN